MAECSVIKPGGKVIYFDNWGSGNVQFSYTIQPTDPLGTWTVDYCGLWSDFELNSGWNLKLNNTKYTFTVEQIQLTVTVTGAPSNWQNTDATASVSCTSNSPAGCDSTTYRLQTYDSNPGSCPSTYSSYTLSSPQAISSHQWVCAAAKDSYDNMGVSTPVEFKVDKTSPTVSVTGAPANWQNTDATASVSCSDTGGSTCDSGTYKLLTYDSNPGSCPSTYTSYILTSPQTISSHQWVCAAAKDVAGNTGFSASAEFLVDKVPPTSKVKLLSTYTSRTSFNLSWNGTDDESGLDCYIIQYRYKPPDGSESGISNITFPDGECTKQTNTTFDAELVTGTPNLDGYTFYFRSLAKDNANNWETKTTFDTFTRIFLGMVRFEIDNRFQAVIAKKEIVRIVVRNSQMTSDIIHLSLDMEEVKFEETGTQTIDLGMNPQEFKELTSIIYPRSLGTFNLTVTAGSTTDPQITDSDWLEIVIGMPAEFPELNWFGACLLIFLSILIYFKLVSKGKTGKKKDRIV